MKLPNGPAGARRRALALALLLAAVQATAQQISFFVATNGNDENSGSKEAPFATIARARDAIRSFKSAGKPASAFSVSIGPGLFAPSVAGQPALALDPAQDSGSANQPITYQGAGTSATTLAAGVPLPFASWHSATQATGKDGSPIPLPSGTMKVDLAAAGCGELLGQLASGSLGQCSLAHMAELHFNGEPQHLAAWPSFVPDNRLNWTRVDKALSGTSFSCSGARCLRWSNERDPWMHGYWKFGWADNYVHVNNVTSSPDGPVVAIDPSTPPVYGLADGARFYGVNLVSELDVPGEYYIDREDQVAYFLPPRPLQLSDSLFLSTDAAVVTTETTTTARGGLVEDRALLRLRQTAQERLHRQASAQELSFTDMRSLWQDVARVAAVGTADSAATEPAATAAGRELLHTLRATPRASAALQHVQFRDLSLRYGRVGLQLSTAASVQVENVDASGMTASGFVISGSNNTVTNVTADASGCQATSLTGGDTTSLTPGGNKAQQVSAGGYARLTRTYNPGMRFGGVGNAYEGCEFFNAPQQAFTGSCNNCMFQYNDLHDLLFEVTDSGAWYAGRSWIHLNNTIQHNTWSRMYNTEPTYLGSPSVQAIYLDDQLGSTFIFNNTITNVFAGLLVGGGRRNIVRGNTFRGCQTPCVHFDDRGLTWQKSYCTPPNGTFEQQLDSVHYTQAPWAIAYPFIVSDPTDHPCTPVYNEFSGNSWCNATAFMDASASNVKAWLSTASNNPEASSCPPS